LRRIVVAEFMTIDGIMEAPGFEEHRTGRNGWVLKRQSEELQEWIAGQFDSIDAFLLGRTTYNIWAAFWPTATAGQQLLDFMNNTPKYVVSSTMKEASWVNTTILGSDWRAALAELKRQPGKSILVEGSADLLADLLQEELVDELQLMVFPVILGSGKRLFRDNANLHNLRLVESRTFPAGVVVMRYVPDREEPSSPFAEQFAWSGEQVRSLQAAQDIDRVLATVLFTDIVDSSGRAAQLGDRAWRRLLDQHDSLARAEVERWHGRFVKSTGDGVLATFDTPTRALRCAFGLGDAVASLGLDIRAGIHTGELELRGTDVGGIAVHIASRALSEAAARGAAVVVTRTVRDLASGSDLAFAPLGSVGLRGIPGEWELFEATERR
jgi:class 3 adenylate cyclase/dihydrofolate reductase